jgi:cupin fold WbuC family metalloprotein
MEPDQARMTRTLRRVSPQATQSDHDRFAVVDAALIRQKARDAAANPRRREVHRLHAEDGETLHRMLNALQPGTYVRPHRHLTPPKAEAFILLSGRLGFVAFDDAGNFGRDDCLVLDAAAGSLAVDVPAGTWHAILALAPDTVVFEVKPGPFRPVSDKDFATWAPAEGTPEATTALMATEDRLRAFLDLPPRPW